MDAAVSPFLCILSFSLAVFLSQARQQQGAMAVERCSMAAPFPCSLSLAVGPYTAACQRPSHLGLPLSSTSLHQRASTGRRTSRSLASPWPSCSGRCGQAAPLVQHRGLPQERSHAPSTATRCRRASPSRARPTQAVICFILERREHQGLRAKM